MYDTTFAMNANDAINPPPPENMRGYLLAVQR